MRQGHVVVKGFVFEMFLWLVKDYPNAVYLRPVPRDMFEKKMMKFKDTEDYQTYVPEAVVLEYRDTGRIENGKREFILTKIIFPRDIVIDSSDVMVFVENEQEKN